MSAPPPPLAHFLRHSSSRHGSERESYRPDEPLYTLVGRDCWSRDTDRMHREEPESVEPEHRWADRGRQHHRTPTGVTGRRGLVKVDDQPVRVTFTNGESNGERPVFYNVTVSTTAEFTDLVHEATGIAPDPSGRTTYTLPTGLDPEQMYYWKTRADDGANASEASSTSIFEVYTPVEIEAPQI